MCLCHDQSPTSRWVLEVQVSEKQAAGPLVTNHNLSIYRVVLLGWSYRTDPHSHATNRFEAWFDQSQFTLSWSRSAVISMSFRWTGKHHRGFFPWSWFPRNLNHARTNYLTASGLPGYNYNNGIFMEWTKRATGNFFPSVQMEATDKKARHEIGQIDLTVDVTRLAPARIGCQQRSIVSG